MARPATSFFAAVLAALLLLGGCATRRPAAVVDRNPPPPRPPVVAVPPAPSAVLEFPKDLAPPAPVAAPAAAEPKAAVHVVRRGDTLGRIAAEYGVDYRDVAAWNNLENPNLLRVGQVLRLRPPGALPETVAVFPSPAPGSQPASGAIVEPSGVVIVPLRSAPPVAVATAGGESDPAAPGSQADSAAAGTALAPGAPPAGTATGSAATASPRAAAAPPARLHGDRYKTEPKALRLPYSESALAQVQRSNGQPQGPGTVAAATPSASTPQPPAQPAITAVPPASAAAQPTPAPPVASLPAPRAAAPASPPSTGVAAARAPATSAAQAATAQPTQQAVPGPVASATQSAATSAATGAAAAPSRPDPGKSTEGAKPAADDDAIEWVWPATGRMIAGFSENGGGKGIDISGTLGQPVVAGADGRVVYAGSGLRGYGKLIIIKHNKTYLSAYAHNHQILVKEGQQVSRGQKIAEMGNSDADQVKLHFEIRRQGKPVDPARYLPPG